MTTEQSSTEAKAQLDATSITRPNAVLMTYYFIIAICTGPGLPFVLLPLLCKYYTLRYRIDDHGISMSWGVLFRREIHLTYRRIQDIHLTRNLIQRWLGLATVAIQTASGSSTPEMSIEGILQANELRDYLYGRMRGAKGEPGDDLTEADAGGDVTAGAGEREALVLLQEIRDLLRQMSSQRKAE